MGPESLLPESPVPEAQPSRATTERGRPTHLVVVRNRPGAASSPSEIVTRYWHPGRRAWQEQTFESREHALHLFVDEHGWELRQQQVLDRPGREELIFSARPEDLDQPSARELLLGEVGLTPEDAEAMLDRVDDAGRAEP